MSRVNRWARVGALTAALLLLTGCGSENTCHRSESSSTCHDLRFDKVSYDEWRAVDAPPVHQMQEVGDGTYPACNNDDNDDGCDDPLEGFGATDVFLVEGVDTSQALIGLRQGTHTYVMFVRAGVDPESLRPLIDPSLLR